MVDILTSQDLLKEQLNAASERSRRVKKPKPVVMAKQAGQRYNSELQMMIRMIRKDVNEQLMPLLKELAPQYQRDSARVSTNDQYTDQIVSTIRMILEKWRSPSFRALGDQIARQFITTADKVNRDRFERTMGGFGFDMFSDSPELQEYISLSISDNSRLITSIADQYLGNVESIVMNNVRAGGRPSAIAKQLTKQFGVTSARAKMIARDQTAKANGDLSARRQTAAGFEWFQWLDSDDVRVRDRHEDIANKVTEYGKGIYRWDNPPLSDTGSPIIPGQDFQCRCTGRPVTAREVKENQDAGRVRWGVKR